MKENQKQKVIEFRQATVHLLQICKKYCNSFFDAIMEAEDRYGYCSHGRGGLQKVNSVLLQTEELHQSVRQFLEYCLTSNSSYAGTQELISEIVAANDISREKAESKLRAFCKKADTLKDICEKTEIAQQKLRSVDCIDFGNASDEKRLAGVSNLVTSLAMWVKLNSKFHKEVRRFLEEFWICLSPEAQNSIEKHVSFLINSRSERKFAEAGVVKGLKRLKPLIERYRESCHSKKIASFNIPSLFASYDNELIQLAGLVFQYADQGRSKKDWYDPDIMENFLDSLMHEVKGDNSKLVPYTKEMDDELEALLDGVEVD